MERLASPWLAPPSSFLFLTHHTLSLNASFIELKQKVSLTPSRKRAPAGQENGYRMSVASTRGVESKVERAKERRQEEIERMHGRLRAFACANILASLQDGVLVENDCLLNLKLLLHLEFVKSLG